jgi:hypothetical protein
VARRDYSREEIEVALTIFALEGGRRRQVVATLAAAGLDIPSATVRTWARSTHHERYEQISTDVEKRIRGQLRDQYHGIARTSGDLAEESLRRIAEELSARDADMLEVEAALERLGEVGDDDKDTLRLRKELWDRRDRLRPQLRDLATLLRDSGVMGGIATEKLLLLTGQATERVEHHFPEIRAALERKGVTLNVGEGRSPAPIQPAIDVPALAVGATDGEPA